MASMSDYKYSAQLIAEELAQEYYGPDADLYQLPQDEQCRLYDEALNNYFERRLPD